MKYIDWYDANSMTNMGSHMITFDFCLCIRLAHITINQHGCTLYSHHSKKENKCGHSPDDLVWNIDHPLQFWENVGHPSDDQVGWPS